MFFLREKNNTWEKKHLKNEEKFKKNKKKGKNKENI